MADGLNDEAIRAILSRTRVIAVVGFSPNPERPSFGVAHFLQSRGYRVIPVNPGQAGKVLLGERVMGSLAELGKTHGAAVDMVDIFRNPEAVPGVVDEALAHLPGLRTIWMQLGIVSEVAAVKARARGVDVVMDRCPKIEIPRLA